MRSARNGTDIVTAVQEEAGYPAGEGKEDKESSGENQSEVKAGAESPDVAKASEAEADVADPGAANASEAEADMESQGFAKAPEAEADAANPGAANAPEAEADKESQSFAKAPGAETGSGQQVKRRRWIWALAGLASAGAVGILTAYSLPYLCVRESVTVEAGQAVQDVSDLLYWENGEAEILSGIAAGEKLEHAEDRRVVVEIGEARVAVLLHVVDTVPPRVELLDKSVYAGKAIAPVEFVEDMGRGGLLWACTEQGRLLCFCNGLQMPSDPGGNHQFGY